MAYGALFGLIVMSGSGSGSRDYSRQIREKIAQKEKDKDSADSGNKEEDQ